MSHRVQLFCSCDGVSHTFLSRIFLILAYCAAWNDMHVPQYPAIGWDRVLLTFCPGWPWTIILPNLKSSQVAEIISMSQFHVSSYRDTAYLPKVSAFMTKLTSQSPHLLIPSHWGLDLKIWTLGGKLHPVYSRYGDWIWARWHWRQIDCVAWRPMQKFRQEIMVFWAGNGKKAVSEI
jgi:hypothetical protein